MSKFQVGDLVRYGNQAIYTVTKVETQPVYTVCKEGGEEVVCFESRLSLYTKLEPVFAIGDYIRTKGDTCSGKIIAIVEDFDTEGDYRYIIDTNTGTGILGDSRYQGWGIRDLRKRSY